MNSVHQNWMIPALVSIVVVTQTPVLAESSPRSTVEEFYKWYLTHQDKGREQISQQKNAFDPKLYQQLVSAFQKQPEDGKWLDFDPFFNSQMGGRAYSVESVRMLNKSTAQVKVSIVGSRGDSGRPIMVMLQKNRDRWQISNFLYPEGFNLLSLLQDINKPAQLRR